MAKKQIVTKSPQETKEFAGALLREWLDINKKKSASWLVCLYGDLGSGKTTFVQGIAQEFGTRSVVNSPTFVIMKNYVSSKKENKKYNLYHFDCYRIEKEDEIAELGWEEIINGENNIIVVEWPEKINGFLPPERLNLEFEVAGKNTRKIKIKNN